MTDWKLYLSDTYAYILTPYGNRRISRGALGLDHPTATVSAEGADEVKDVPEGIAQFINQAVSKLRDTQSLPGQQKKQGPTADAITSSARRIVDLGKKRIRVLNLLLEDEPSLTEIVHESAIKNQELVSIIWSRDLKLLALHRPATQTCPLCLTNRIRARHPWRDIASIPLYDLLGQTTDSDTTVDPAQVDDIVRRWVLGALPGLDTAHTLAGRNFEEHLIPPSPSCSIDGLHKSMADAVAPDRIADQTLGIVGSVELANDSEVSEGLSHAVTVGKTDTRQFAPVEGQASGSAVKDTVIGAKMAALGEAIERYCSAIYSPHKLKRSTFSHLSAQAIHPSDIQLASDRELALPRSLSRYTEATEIDWVVANLISNGLPIWVPAAAVYLPFKVRKREELLFRPISTGLAAGTSLAMAQRNALIEIIERDAFVIFWENKLTVPSLDVTSLPQENIARIIYERYLDAGIDIVCKDITTDNGIPAVLVSSIDRHSQTYPLVAHSARAGLTYTEAILGALSELGQVRDGIVQWLKRQPVPKSADDLKTMSDYFTYYCREDRLDAISFVRQGDSKPVPDSEIEREPLAMETQVSWLEARLSAVGLDALYVDLTTADAAWASWRVARVLVPGLQPVSFNRNFRHLGNPRLYQEPVKRGLLTHPKDESQLNVHPVPGG
ncbi:YcaO-like family protein [Flexivirga oryzae]|uniref:Ribosomal protein S12 methylthiotransferase accessory factor n=1 Tax=Flexivirga oryzae TaxID=1794944 RepID=A0A839N5Q4_9MICO|nr:YcaO-like family protein [Flexivirga oryzae]MBB2890966.1 ribosomal protein S12 methylthiotransferase accessory factor [Flexivirga oryzae]